MGRTFWLVLLGCLLVALVSMLLTQDTCACTPFDTATTAPVP
jgi:hypothetical protein